MQIESLENRTLFSIDTNPLFEAGGAFSPLPSNLPRSLVSVIATAQPDNRHLVIAHGFPKVFARTDGFSFFFARRTVATIRLIDGALKINGTNFGDAISVSQSDGTLTINLDGVVRTFSAADVNKIVINGNGGGDVIDIGSNISAPVRAFGGSGNNLIVGGKPADFFSGGSGHNILLGNARFAHGLHTFASHHIVTPFFFNPNSLIGVGFNSGLGFFSTAPLTLPNETQFPPFINTFPNASIGADIAGFPDLRLAFSTIPAFNTEPIIFNPGLLAPV